MIIELIVFVPLFGIWGYLIWALQKRLEKLTIQHSNLVLKVKHGEDAIIENFQIIEKSIKRLENEIKNLQRVAPKNKEAIKAANKAQRLSRDE